MERKIRSEGKTEEVKEGRDRVGPRGAESGGTNLTKETRHFLLRKRIKKAKRSNTAEECRKNHAGCPQLPRRKYGELACDRAMGGRPQTHGAQDAAGERLLWGARGRFGNNDHKHCQVVVGPEGGALG